MKRIKIKDARIRSNRMFLEDQRMFHRKTQGAKQMRGEVPKMKKKMKNSGQVSGKTTPKPYKENG